MKPKFATRIAPAILPIILFCTYLLSAAWAMATPVPNNDGPSGPVWGNFHPDEGSHTSVIRYMAIHRVLPPYRSPYDTSVHPPLFHGVAAAIYGISVPTFGDEWAMRIVRLCNSLCGVGVVYLTFAATRRLASLETALLAAVLVALVPMRVALGGAVTNENLAALGAAGALAVLIGGLCDRGGFTGRQIALLTVYVAIGTGSKVTCLGLIPAAVLALLVRGRRSGLPASRIVLQATTVIVGTIVCWGWWFARNQIVYGDPLRQAAANRLWDKVQPGFAGYAITKHVSAIRYALSLTVHGWLSFWGKFDGFRYYMPFPFYAIPLLLETTAIVGLWRLIRGFPIPGDTPVADPDARNDSGDLGRQQPIRTILLLFATFAAFVLVVYYEYNWRHYTPQGRYFFVLLLPFGLMLAIGYQAGLSRAIRRWSTPVTIVLLVILNLYLLYVVPRRIAMPLGFARIRPNVSPSTAR